MNEKNIFPEEILNNTIQYHVVKHNKKTSILFFVTFFALLIACLSLPFIYVDIYTTSRGTVISQEKKLNIFDADTIHELSTFVERNGSYSADEGYHDDLVMTLVLFGWLTTNQYFRELTDVNVRERIYKQQMAQIEEELTPFGFVDDGFEETTFVSGNIVWSTDKSLPWKQDIDS